MPVRRHKLSMRYLYGILLSCQAPQRMRQVDFAFLANRFQLTDNLLIQQYVVWTGAYAMSFELYWPLSAGRCVRPAVSGRSMAERQPINLASGCGWLAVACCLCCCLPV